MTDKNTATALRRAALPEVMFGEDVGVVLGIETALATAALEQRLLGPTFWVGNRPAVLRTEFLKHLSALGFDPRHANGGGAK
jgi:hypothetical protein